jgi:2-polyprenyl-6-methoxyphenol hydroxylase-like FAD-dependent oxidoreductase
MLLTQDLFSSTDRTGYGFYVVTRPVLYKLILKLVPPPKILFGKKVVSITETDDKVTVRTSDNARYEGDILVGADGAHSTVRHHLYEKLKNKGELPKSDQEDLPFSCTCLVGQTRTLDPEELPLLKEPVCQFLSVMSDDKPYSVGGK